MTTKVFQYQEVTSDLRCLVHEISLVVAALIGHPVSRESFTVISDLPVV